MKARFLRMVAGAVCAIGVWGCGEANERESDVAGSTMDDGAFILDDDESELKSTDASSEEDHFESLDASEIGDPDAAGLRFALLAACKLNVDMPHYSTHVPGTVNVVSRVTCTRAVLAIRMVTSLRRDGIEVASRTVANSDVISLRVKIPTPCVDGRYRATASATVVYGPGFLPSSKTFEDESRSNDITCQ